MSLRQFTKEEEGRIYAVKTYILNHLHERLTTKQLARKAAMGEQKFREEFYEIFGVPVGFYLHRTKMKTSDFLLKNTNRAVKEIALLCGYSKTRNFSSAYKKFWGSRPSEERMKSC